MTHGFQRFGIILGLLALVAACGGEIHRVDSVGYGYGPQKGVTLAQMRAAIESSATGRGWRISNVKPGSFVAKRAWGAGKHNIAVTVSYDPKTFSIRYKDSQAMGYDGRFIHHTYNDMVRELEESIQTSVSRLKAQGSAA